MTDQTILTPTAPDSLPAEARYAVYRDAKTTMLYDANKKSLGVSYLLWFLLGGVGGHRFYNGRKGSAVAMLLLTILCLVLLSGNGLGPLLLFPVWIWEFVDAFLIPSWIRNHNNLLARQLGA